MPVPDSIQTWASDSQTRTVAIEVNGETEYLSPDEAEQLAGHLVGHAQEAR